MRVRFFLLVVMLLGLGCAHTPPKMKDSREVESRIWSVLPERPQTVSDTVRYLVRDVRELEKKAAAITVRLDSLTKVNQTAGNELLWTVYWKYTWFDLGREFQQIVDGHFYVSSIKTSFHENGFEVTGIIANLDALSKSNVKIQCAIKDTSVAEKLTFGFSEIPVLPPGIKRNFSVFVPTKQTKIPEIGISIPEYRQ